MQITFKECLQTNPTNVGPAGVALEFGKTRGDLEDVALCSLKGHKKQHIWELLRTHVYPGAHEAHHYSRCCVSLRCK